MRYIICKAKTFEMSNLEMGTKCIKLLLSKASNGMDKPHIPMFFVPKFAVSKAGVWS